MREAAPIISLRRVGKDYPLYASPGQRMLDGMGVYRMLPAFMRPQISLHHALVDATLDIKAGERVGIVGRNGAGKTTMLKLVTGSIVPTRGEVSVKGDVHSLMQTGLGFSQDFTGAENIRASLAYNKLPDSEIEQAYADIVAFCELGDHLEQPFKTYSAGMASRLQFAAATAINPDILIIDEVLGAGDSYFLQKSAKRMEKLARSGTTLLLVSHATQQVLHFCERALWIEEGRIVMDGPALEVANAYDVFLERRTMAYRLKAEGHDTGGPADTDGAGGPQRSLTTRLADGREVYRWPGKPGLKVHSLSLGDGTRQKETFRKGDDIVIDMCLVAEETGQFRCRYLITFWTPKGFRVGRLENEIDEFVLQAGEIHDVSFTIPCQPLVRGEYLLSFSIYGLRDDNSTERGADIRYDVLAHALRLSIDPTDAGHGYLIQHPVGWSAVDAKKAKLPHTAEQRLARHA